MNIKRILRSTAAKIIAFAGIVGASRRRCSLERTRLPDAAGTA